MTIAELQGLAEHARLSHGYWLACARNGGNGRYGPAYCLDGAASWRRRYAELLTQIRAKRRPRERHPTEAQRKAGLALARAAARVGLAPT